jgi:hypothetical protein
MRIWKKLSEKENISDLDEICRNVFKIARPIEDLLTDLSQWTLK